MLSGDITKLSAVLWHSGLYVVKAKPDDCIIVVDDAHSYSAAAKALAKLASCLRSILLAARRRGWRLVGLCIANVSRSVFSRRAG